MIGKSMAYVEAVHVIWKAPRKFVLGWETLAIGQLKKKWYAGPKELIGRCFFSSNI